MIDIKKEEKELHKQALYLHLIHKGYSFNKAEFIVKRIFRDRENIVWLIVKKKILLTHILLFGLHIKNSKAF